MGTTIFFRSRCPSNNEISRIRISTRPEKVLVKNSKKIREKHQRNEKSHDIRSQKPSFPPFPHPHIAYLTPPDPLD
jgi:hypothetical protein